MSEKKSIGHEFLFNPLLGLSPVIVVSILEIYVGLNIALHVGMLVSIAVLMKNYFSKEYSNEAIVIINLFLFTTYQFISSHIYIIAEGSISEALLYHGLILISLGSSFFLKAPLFAFFDRKFAGSSKHLESNLREFYFITRCLMVLLSFHIILYLLSFVFPLFENVYKLPVVDYIESALLILLVIFVLFRICKIAKVLDAEEFWPIVNKVGVVIGKVAQSVSLMPSCHKEMHPVVRIHFLHKDTVLMYRNEEAGSDGKWDCAISKHVLYGESMEQTIARIALNRYNIREDFKPHFLLKHVVEKELEKQYVLLYYTAKIESACLVNQAEGQLKYWPTWQIEENLGKGVFSEAFEIEYEYLKNTVFIAEQFCNNEEDCALI